MKKDTLPQKLYCLLWSLIGSAICGLGIQMTLVSGVGVDPLTMFEEGVFKTTGIPVGTVALMTNLFVLILGFFLCRRMVGWGSLVCTLAVGSSINLWAGLGFVTAPNSLVGRVALDAAGVLVIGLGIALYMLPDYGVGGMEALMVYFSEKLHTPIGPTRVVMDCIWGALGLLLGGTLGIGTVIGAFGIGMSIQLFYRPLVKLVGR